ncbi:MAG: SDR family oxidoreductase [Alphaproteobacteria bacterium]|nr:SDR family oxidoreductase [Alphaproteobacteria bacterium]MDE2161540.1 SDR family oxidoreductase [Alphaproteobacteria bacterium]MDE2266555.1 SDR family oxidoreductase [Alphaproteobacteria bacterium]
MNRFSLAGKNAVVTGGSRGIGRAIAVGLAEAGADVVLTYRENRGEAEKVVKQIESLGRRALALQMDVTHRTSVAAAAKDARGFGPISILVNNAGINKPTDFDQVSDEDWDTILTTNLKGPFVCAQVFLPLLAQAGGGSIVHIGSVSGQYGGPRTAHYAASKAGLISLAQVIARFAAPQSVRSNTVAAGLIASDMAAAGMAAASVQKAAESIILKRMGLTREVADTVVFLASEASSYITAQTINVNGGLYF